MSLTFQERVLEWMEINREEVTKKRKSIDLVDEKQDFSRDSKINDFVYSVHDKSHILYKLAHLGYFDVENSGKFSNKNESVKTYQYINILIASISTSFALAFIMCPLDLVIFRHKFAKSSLNVGVPKSLRDSQSIRRTVQDLVNKQGRGLMFSATFLSTFIRYLFILTSQSIYINYNLISSK